MDSEPSNLPYLVESIFQINGIDPKKTTRRLAISWEAIQEMARDPLVTIGAHTVNHVALKKLSDEEMFCELSHSKKRIESVIGFPVTAISYPFGGQHEVGAREFEAAGTIGFTTGTTTKLSSIFRKHKNNPTSLPRWNVDGNNEDVHELEYNSGYIPFIRRKESDG
jgi:peptidoglycan/xylan/chitin deacetylase (PgdA/CDA1 family)